MVDSLHETPANSRVRRQLLPNEQRQRQGAWLLLISLGMFFVSSIILYGLLVAARAKRGVGHLELPSSFLWSTVILVLISFALHQAVRMSHRDKVVAIARWLLGALGLSLAFMLIQGYGMASLLMGEFSSEELRNSVYAFTFFLAFVHALHVLGGVIALTVVSLNAIRREYDHERFYGLQFCANYWHFLDIVWLAMLASFAIASVSLQSN